MNNTTTTTTYVRVLDSVEVGNHAAHLGQGMVVVVGKVISDAREATVDVSATQVLCRHHLTSGGLDQRWAS